MTLFQRYGSNDKWEKETSSDEERDVQRRMKNNKKGEAQQGAATMQQQQQKRPGGAKMVGAKPPQAANAPQAAPAPPVAPAAPAAPENFFKYLLFLSFFAPEGRIEPIPLDPSSDDEETRKDKLAIIEAYPAYKSFCDTKAHRQHVFDLVRSLLPARSAISKFHEEMIKNKSFKVIRDATPPKRALDALHPDAQAPNVCVSNDQVCIYTDAADLLAACHCIYHFYDYASDVMKIRLETDAQELSEMSFIDAWEHIKEDPTLAKLSSIWEASHKWT